MSATSVTRIEIGTRPGFVDSRAEAVSKAIRAHLGIATTRVRTRDVYLIEPGLPRDEACRVAEAFAGPVLRCGAVSRLDDGPFDVAISVGYRPGVTDPVGMSAKVAIEDLLGLALGPTGRVYASRMYLLDGIAEQDASRVARELLANELIERIGIWTYDTWQASPPDLVTPRVLDAPVPDVLTIDLALPDDELTRISREGHLALTLRELHAVRAFFERAADDPARRELGLAGAPTDVELECIAQTWSEHCKHKIFNATIRYVEGDRPPETVEGLFRTYVRGTTERLDATFRRDEGRSWLVSVFHDNAGVIEATARHDLVFKVETHNSPSALDPYGGAITGIVGVNRDPFGTGMGSELLCNTWGYCFAPPEAGEDLPAGLLHPARIRDGVHAGVIDGGNQSGVPYARGWEYFDERFLGKPLVYCGTVGRMPKRVCGRPAHEKSAQPGDRIVMVGGRIGKDGIHGATFSSAELTEESPVQAVQIGDPITQKMMFDFLLEARDLGLYSAITDNGAGGLSSSVGEMAESPGGARLELAAAPLKYQGLAPWEILVSEAQERMTLAVPVEKLAEFQILAERREVLATDLGEFTDDGVFHVTYGGRTVAYLPLSFLHGGIPEMTIDARWSEPKARTWRREDPEPETVLRRVRSLLQRRSIASSESICRRYDHEVKGLTIVKPWIGCHGDVPSDATVMQVAHGGWDGYAVSDGVFPRYSDVDAHAMAQAGIDLMVRRLIAAGGRPDRIAALDNYCWPDPLPSPSNPDAERKAAHLVRAARGMADACLAYGVPLISGKDSMKNDAVIGGRRISIPPTLLMSGIALVRDVRQAMTLEPSGPGDRLIIVGETRDELGATEYAALRGVQSTEVPRCRPREWAGRYKACATAIEERLVTAVHAPGLGGLLPALCRMARSCGAGLEVSLDALPHEGAPGWEALLFGESCGRLLLACREREIAALKRLLGPFHVAEIGRFNDTGRLRATHGGSLLLDEDVGHLASAWRALPRDDA